MKAGATARTDGGPCAGQEWIGEVDAELRRTRARTLALVAKLPDDDLQRQVCDFLSPLLWDLHHIGSFEELWLVGAVEGRAERRLDRELDAAATPRSERGRLVLPGRDDAIRHLAAVRARSLALLDRTHSTITDALVRDGFVYRMVIQHEAQHQETMLQALDFPAEDWAYSPPVPPGPPTLPATTSGAGATNGAETAAAASLARDGSAPDQRARVRIPAGRFPLGTDDRSRAYDNERGRHEVDVGEFELERFPVTNGRWVEFIQDDGYRRDELWSEDGNRFRRSAGIESPQGWRRVAGAWRVRCFGAWRPLAHDEPVQHVSYWEAEAFASWCGGRLPSETEIEKAAAWDPTAAPRTYPWGDHGPVEAGVRWADPAAPRFGPGPSGRWGPEPVGRHPERASAYGVEDLMGGVYAWTASPLRPYPGFTAFPYPEYSEVFFGDRYRVLRGSSWAAHPMLWRNTYRNWDLPERRHLFAGARVAYDV